MQIPNSLKTSHGRLATANREFLNFVERYPECLARSTFAALDRADEVFVPFPLQSWPIFLDRRTVDELERVCVEIPRLIQSVPERILGNDPEKVAAFYDIDPRGAAFLVERLKEQVRSRGMMARGDYVYTADGFRCLEVNTSSALGGWQSKALESTYLEIPAIARFLTEHGLTATCRDTVRAFLAYQHAESRGLAEDGELNVALRVSAGEKAWRESEKGYVQRWERYLARRWNDFLREQGSSTVVSVTTCEDSDFEVRRERLYRGGTRIHVVIEYRLKPPPRRILAPWLAGNLALYSGPVRTLLNDKRTLALLSELAGSDDFSAEERALVEKHVPWNRCLRPGKTRYRGREWDLADLVETRRDELVIKSGGGFGGQEVHLGRATPADEWRAHVRSAIRDGDWVVQERVDSLPFLMQHGESGCVPHTLIWGFFAYGDAYGGGWLRMAPQADGRIISSRLGATEGLFFEVEDRDTPPARRTG